MPDTGAVKSCSLVRSWAFDRSAARPAALRSASVNSPNSVRRYSASVCARVSVMAASAACALVIALRRPQPSLLSLRQFLQHLEILQARAVFVERLADVDALLDGRNDGLELVDGGRDGGELGLLLVPLAAG